MYHDFQESICLCFSRLVMCYQNVQCLDWPASSMRYAIAGSDKLFLTNYDQQ